MIEMRKCQIKSSASRDYYTVGVLGSYWESIHRHLGDTVELISSESIGKKRKRLVFTVEIKDVKKFEKYIKKSCFENWSFVRNYSLKAYRKELRLEKANAKAKKLEETNTKLF